MNQRMGARQVVLHVGAHKTGTTSIQEFLRSHLDAFRAQGIDFFRGEYISSNHVELHLAAMRTERMSPFKQENGIVVTAELRHRIRERVQAYLANSPYSTVVFSNEGMSLLRNDDEMRRLRDLVEGYPAKIVFYTREPGAFLASYAPELKRWPNILPSDINPDSFANLAEDSWLVDFDERIRALRKTFGVENVAVIDYDREMKEVGTVLRSFLLQLGLPPDFLQEFWADFFLNRHPHAQAN